MVKLNDYYYVKYDGKTITMNTNDEFRIVGRVYDSPRYPDDSIILTSPIIKIKDNVALTFSGQEYQLENKSSIQEAFKNGIPIIKNARIKKCRAVVDSIDSNSPDFAEQMLQAEVREFDVIIGTDTDGNGIYGEVIAENGKLFTLRVYREESMDFEEKDVYVYNIL